MAQIGLACARTPSPRVPCHILVTSEGLRAADGIAVSDDSKPPTWAVSGARKNASRRGPLRFVLTARADGHRSETSALVKRGRGPRVVRVAGPTAQARRSGLMGREFAIMSGATRRYGRASPGSPGDDFPAASCFLQRSVVRGHPAFVSPVDVWWTQRSAPDGSALDVLLAKFRGQGSRYVLWRSGGLA